MTTEPTDAELKAMWQLHAADIGGIFYYARAVLAKWGQPAQAAEPVAWRVHPFDYGIGYEGVYAMTMREDQRETWRRKGWNTEPLFTAPQPVEREPLPSVEIMRIVMGVEQQHNFLRGTTNWATAVGRAVERAHGIGGQHGTE